MMDEVERLMSEVKGATETIAHDLITPLTRASTQLHRLQQADSAGSEDFVRLTAEVDGVLDRFRAILRISELEARSRRAGFLQVDLVDIVTPVVDLYQPLAEAGGVWLSAAGERGKMIEADPKLLIEAVSNLVDNAIKFSGSGGAVQVRLGEDPAQPQIIIQDNGPGIAAEEHDAVLQRFYRSERNRLTPGTGLGLSIVAAIIRLHGFTLTLEDARPGLRIIIDCKKRAINY
jgi:signal transduction histidine kinase